MGWNTFTAIQNQAALANGIMMNTFVKGIGTTTVGRGYSPWLASGNPGAGASPAAGLGSAVAVDKDTAGAMPVPSPAGGSANNYLFRAGVGRNSALITSLQGPYLIADKLCHAVVNNNEATGSFSPTLDATARLASGEGGLIIVEVDSALSAASNTFTLTYTNQAGTTGRTSMTMTTVASAGASTFPHNDYFFVPLQAGDTGVRAITGWTLNSGTATGELMISIVKPLLWVSTVSLGEYTEHDTVIQKMNLVRVHDNACIAFYTWPANNSGSQILSTLEFMQS